MRNNDGKLTSGQLEGFRAIKMIPLTLRFATGAWTAVQNPTNEAIVLTGGATAPVITLSNPGVAPLQVLATPVTGTAVVASAPTTAAATLTVATATDVHVLLVKMEQA